MTVILSAASEKILETKLQTGEYKDASEVIEDALCALEAQNAQDYKEAVEGIHKGIEAARMGRTTSLEEFEREMRAKHGIPR